MYYESTIIDCTHNESYYETHSIAVYSACNGVRTNGRRPVQHCCECARSARRNFRVSLRGTADFRPPVTPCQQIFALRYENLFCVDSVRGSRRGVGERPRTNLKLRCVRTRVSCAIFRSSEDRVRSSAESRAASAPRHIVFLRSSLTAICCLHCSSSCGADSTAPKNALESGPMGPAGLRPRES